MFFIGWACLSIVVPAHADKYGRKNTILVSFIITTIAAAMILFSTSVYVLLVGSLLLGMMAPGRVTVAFVYMQEFVTPQWRTFVGSISSLLFVLFSAIVVVYLRYVAPYSSHLIAVAVILGFISSACVYFFLDESALFLIKTGQHERAEKVILRMFALN